MTWKEAALECCLRNMSMASLDDEDVMQVLQIINLGQSKKPNIFVNAF